MKKPAQNVIQSTPGNVPGQNNGMPSPPTARLKDFCGVKAHLVWVVKNLELGLLEPKIANSLTVALNTLSGVMSDFDLEQRIEKLEAKANEKQS